MSGLRNHFANDSTSDDAHTVSTGASAAPLLQQLRTVSLRWPSVFDNGPRETSRAISSFSWSAAGASRGSMEQTVINALPQPRASALAESDAAYTRKIRDKLEMMQAQYTPPVSRPVIRRPPATQTLPTSPSPPRSSSVVANASTERSSVFSDAGSARSWVTTSLESVA